jgi:hypothetical protein
MASAIKQLSDADREAINHMIRRDAHSDLEIAREAERRLGEELSPTDAGRMAVVGRYRKSEDFVSWLKRYLAERSDMERALAEQRHRYEMLSSLVQNGPETGIEGVSKFLQTRLLELAAKTSDADLIDNFGKSGWVKNLIAATQSEQRLALARALSEKAVEAEAVAGSSTLSADERARRMREIFGRAA